jgi:hypothetical protein
VSVVSDDSEPHTDEQWSEQPLEERRAASLRRSLAPGSVVALQSDVVRLVTSVTLRSATPPLPLRSAPRPPPAYEQLPRDPISTSPPAAPLPQTASPSTIASTSPATRALPAIDPKLLSRPLPRVSDDGLHRVGLFWSCCVVYIVCMV